MIYRGSEYFKEFVLLSCQDLLLARIFALQSSFYSFAAQISAACFSWWGEDQEN